MQISVEKSKIMINSNNRNIPTNIQLYGEKLEEVDQFKYFEIKINRSVLYLQKMAQATLRLK